LGEIDIVARREALLIFVEVKARGRIDDAAYAVTARQQKRIAGAAGAWLAAHPEDAQCDMRFDAILIAPRHPPRHITGAFEAE
jgi:putative endonuclease